MALVIADNSLLQVLTTIQRLDLLGRNLPVQITKSVRREHEKRAPHPAEQYLQERIKAGDVVVRSARVDTQADHIAKQFRRLSFPDAECLAFAAQVDGFLLAEDRALLEAAYAMDVVGVDLVAILLANRDAGRLDKAELASIVAAIELDADHTFTAAQRSAMGM